MEEQAERIYMRHRKKKKNTNLNGPPSMEHSKTRKFNLSL
jgi:hypothetical protein